MFFCFIASYVKTKPEISVKLIEVCKGDKKRRFLSPLLGI